VHRHEVDGAAAERLVLGAWHQQGSYIRCEAGSYQLIELPR
jgi:UDP-2,3-diacylglucosamine hydrolase